MCLIVRRRLGCITPNVNAKVETAHRQMAKHMPGLPECTPDPATLDQMGWVSTECLINRKCMLLAWKLLNLQDGYIIKIVALYRFVHFLREGDPPNNGHSAQ